MPNTVNLYEAKTHLSKLVERAAAGEEIIIAKAGTPRARLVPLEVKRPVRKPGGWKGKVWISPDFDDPLPPDILAAFYGGTVPDWGEPQPPQAKAHAGARRHANGR